MDISIKCTRIAGSLKWLEMLYSNAAPKPAAVIIHQRWYSFIQDILNFVVSFGNGQHQVGNKLNFTTEMTCFRITFLRMIALCYTYVIRVLQIDIIGNELFHYSLLVIYWMRGICSITMYGCSQGELTQMYYVYCYVSCVLPFCTGYTLNHKIIMKYTEDMRDG